MEFLKKWGAILGAILLGIVLVVVDVCSTPNTSSLEGDEIDYEEYARQLVEGSQIKVKDTIYNGVYGNEEITSVPDGYTLYGVIEECVGLDGELVNDLSSNSVSEGYEVYTNPSTDSIYLRVSTDEDEIQSFIEYKKN